VEWLRGWIGANPAWSRKRIARELCVAWDWRDDRGRLKDFAARSLLLKLAERGRIGLPALRENQRRTRPTAPTLPDWVEPPAWASSLAQVAPVDLVRVEAATADQTRWAFYLERFHYLGWKVVGENLGYLIRAADGRELGCLLFGAAAWRCGARDRWLGWDEATRRRDLPKVVNNTRCLILPWVRVPHLASHALGRVARRIDGDWRSKYGHGLEWLETFVDTERFAGTCYRAANWKLVGFTQGRSRQDRHHRLKVPRKAVWLYRLSS
jgi:hypothetical protein